ncbi:MAG: beta-propeller fold lactonase family protein [Gammaproteobacteria bacterium]
MIDRCSRRRFLGGLGVASGAIAASGWAVRRAAAQVSDTASLYAYVGCFTSEARGARGDGINVYRIDSVSGDWHHVQLVPDLVNPSFLAIDREHRFVYSAHGDEDYATAFAIDSGSGRLTPIGWTPSGGERPRFFGLDPAGEFLYACNERGHNIVAFRVDAANGALIPTAQRVAAASPVTIVFTGA